MAASRSPAGEAALTTRFGPLARAVAGRSLRIAPVGEGELTYTDAQAIFIRTAPLADAVSEITVQAMLLAGGSLAPRHMAALIGQPARARRYLLLEASRLIVTAEPLVLWVLAGRLSLPMASTNNPAESLAASRRAPEPPEEPLLGRLRPSRVLAHSGVQARGEARQEDVRQPGRTIEQDREQLDDDEEADDIPAALKRMASSLNLPNVLARLFHQALGTRRAPGQGAPGAEIPTTSVRQSRQPMPHGRRVGYRFEEQPEGESDIASGMWLYPEWDELRQAYRQDWCSVHQRSQDHIVDVGERRVFRPDPWLEAAIRRLTPALRRVGRQADGDELDLDAVVEHAVRDRVQARHGGSRDAQPRVYSGPRHVARDLAVQLVIDVSGSVAERDRGGAAIIDEQVCTAAALTRAFTLAGDRVAAMAFHSQGRGHCRAIALKGFNERSPGPALRRILSLAPSGYTRLGAGVRHAAARIVEDGGSTRSLMILLSDGVPYDFDYSGRYGVADVAAALREAHTQGIRVLWLSFGTMVPELRQALTAGPHRLIEAESYAALRERLPRAIFAMTSKPAAPLRRAA